tara:strand:+ start:249 stop:1145 length:897 start_codon:yes stop_codon:yes gene_type:complete
MEKFRIIFLIISLVIITGCQGNFSLREQQILADIPEDQQKYSKGIVSNPEIIDIEKAISFGESSKDNSSLMYAYIKKGPSNFWSSSDVYLKIETPLYLVASHSKEQAREYREIDSQYLEYCKNLDAVKLSLTQQFNRSFTAYPIKREIILLHNGKRVKTLSSIESYNNNNPFMSEQEKQIAKLTSDAMRKYSSLMPSSSIMMSEEQLTNIEASYTSMGFTEDQIKTYMALITKGTNINSELTKKNTNIPLTETDNIYKIGDLNKLGTYEIVFRTLATNNILASGDKEIRFPISFSGFK